MGSDTLLVNFLGELEFCFFRDWHNYHYIWHRGKIHRKICSYGLVPSTTWKVFFKFLNFAFSECLIHLREIFIVLQAWSLSQIQRCNSFLMVFIKDYLHSNWLRRVQYWRRVLNSPSTSQSLCSFLGNSRTPKFQTSWKTLSSKVLCRQKILKVDPAMVKLPHRFQSRPTISSQDQLISILFWVIKNTNHRTPFPTKRT